MKGSCEMGQQVDQNYITGYFEKKKKNSRKVQHIGSKNNVPRLWIHT